MIKILKKYTQGSVKSNKKSLAIFVILAVGLAGVLLLNATKAATPFVLLEAESGTIGAPGIILSDQSASANKAVQFKSVGGSSDGGCDNNGVVAPCIGGANTGAEGWGDTVFADEFNGVVLDKNKWAPCWFPRAFSSSSDVCGKMNDSETLKSNVRVENGNVILRQSTVSENSSSDDGALIMSLPSEVDGVGFTMTDGYFAEARVHFPGNGTNCYNWPAWWINGPESGFSDGEIDVAEIGGTGRMTSNYHFDRGNGREITQFTVGSGAQYCGDYHVYGVDRQDGQNIIYVDGVEVTRYPTYDNGAQQYLIFNVGYKTGKTPKAGPESDVYVDYVRVWKK